jgi:hypothetical protein
MEKIIKIGGKEIGLKSTAGTMMRYRNNFNRDFIKDLVSLQGKLTQKMNKGTEFEALDLDMFEKIAWCMAKTYDNNIPDIENWLDEFETFDIMQVLPEIMNLLVANMEQINNKKKLEAMANK